MGARYPRTTQEPVRIVMSSNTFMFSALIGAAFSAGYSNTFKTAKTDALELGKVYRQTNKRLDSASAVIKYRDQLQLLKRKQAQVGGSSARLNRGVADLEKRYRKAKAEAKGYGLSIGGIVREQNRLQKEAKQTKRALRDLEQAKRNKAIRRDIGGKLLGVSVAAYGVGRMFSGSLDQERAKVRLGTVINAPDRDEAVAQSVKSASSFARNSLASTEEILNIEYSLNSAGLDAEASRFGSQLVSKVATVTSGSSEEVGTIVGDLFNNMGDQIEGNVEQRLNRIGDILTKTQFKFSIKNFGQLGESLKEGAVGAIAANVGLEQTAAILGQLNSAGQKGSQAGTSYNAMLRQMSKASDELGFSMVRNKDGQLDVIKTLEDLDDKLSAYDDIDERNNVIQKLFGDEGKKGLVLLLKNFEQLKANYEEVKSSSSGLVDKEYERFNNASFGQWTRFTNNLKEIGTTLANTILPGLNAFLGSLATAAGWVGQLFEKFPLIGSAIGGLVAGSTSIYALGLSGHYVFSIFKDGFILLRKGLLTVTELGKKLIWVGKVVAPVVVAGIRAIGTAIMANPIGAIIGAIAIGASVIIAYWEPIKGFFIRLWSDIKAVFSKAWSWIKSALRFTPMGIIAQNWKPIKGFFGRMWQSVKSLFASGWEWVKKGLSFTPIGILSKNWEPITGFFSNLWGGVKNIFAQAVSWIGDYVFGPIAEAIRFIGDFWDSLFGDDEKKLEVEKSLVVGATVAAAPVAASALLSLPVPVPTNQQISVQAPISVSAGNGADTQQLAKNLQPELDVMMQRAIDAANRRQQSKYRAAHYD